MARQIGFEPMTLRFVAEYSTPLSYKRINGEERGIRTLGPRRVASLAGKCLKPAQPSLQTIWCLIVDLNHGPFPYQETALTY